MPMKPVKKPAPAAPALSLRAGDSVEHSAFGRGTVLSVRPMGPDSILEVAFEKEGTKKLMLSSAGKFMKKL
jgi:DNA helicase-2/ATP-dependent DNA helicase PcrA